MQKKKRDKKELGTADEVEGYPCNGGRRCLKREEGDEEGK